MKLSERIIFGCVFGLVLPIFLFVSSWWLSLGFVQESNVFKIGLIGFAIGCLANLIFLKRWLKNTYFIDTPALALVYIFYSVGVFGFFMGVPVFNLAVGALAGIFMGRKFKYLGLDEERLSKSVSQVSAFMGSSMVLVSLASAYFASKDLGDTALNLRGMFKLSFTPTNAMIIGLIIVGGAALVFAQYILTKKLIRWAYNLGN